MFHVQADVGLSTERAFSRTAVFIVGASSVGKTTLCTALAKQLQVEPGRWVQEVARQVMRTQGFTRDNTHELAMQQAIMSAQLEAEDAALNMTCSSDRVILLSDRSAVDPAVYAQISSSVDGAERKAKMLNSESVKRKLPLYRESLFGKCATLLYSPSSDNKSLTQSSFNPLLTG